MMKLVTKAVFSVIFLVGGGTAFSSSAPTGLQAVAAGLVPAGLTPVAFFPPTNTQTLQALSVIFLEAPVKKRKRRSSFRGINYFCLYLLSIIVSRFFLFPLLKYFHCFRAQNVTEAI